MEGYQTGFRKQPCNYLFLQRGMTDMNEQHARPCPDCEGVSRREFLIGAVAAATAAGSLTVPAAARAAGAAASKPTELDAAVAQLHGTMTEAQKRAVCFAWDHPKRLMVDNNWMIVPQKIGEFYTPEQQELILQIFKGTHSSEEWVQKRLKQLQDDAGGIGNYSIALFGQPGTDRYEWVMTGRHLTLRVDGGHGEQGVAFGGPIFYGHAAHGFNEKADHPDNVYWYQARRANEVFQSLDGKQRKQALVPGAVPSESGQTVIPLAKERRPGIPVAVMSRDQRELVGKVLDDLLQPMNADYQARARKLIETNGGAESLSMAFYSADDIGNDGVWDVWMLEGPSMVWYFRGAPHVHTWVYVQDGHHPAPLTSRQG